MLMPLSSGLSSNGSVPQPLVRTAEGSPATLAFVGISSWWHLQVYTLQWRSKGGLWRNNYETRVCECLWLTDYARSNVSNASGAGGLSCPTAVTLAVPKTQVVGTGNNDELGIDLSFN